MRPSVFHGLSSIISRCKVLKFVKTQEHLEHLHLPVVTTSTWTCYSLILMSA